jgi:hypothetical protein
MASTRALTPIVIARENVHIIDPELAHLSQMTQHLVSDLRSGRDILGGQIFYDGTGCLPP